MVGWRKHRLWSQEGLDWSQKLITLLVFALLAWILTFLYSDENVLSSYKDVNYATASL